MQPRIKKVTPQNCTGCFISKAENDFNRANLGGFPLEHNDLVVDSKDQLSGKLHIPGSITTSEGTYPDRVTQGFYVELVYGDVTLVSVPLQLAVVVIGSQRDGVNPLWSTHALISSSSMV